MPAYQVPDTTIYQQAPEGLVVVELDGGAVYHFNHAAQAVLDHFREPDDVDGLIRALGVDGVEAQHLRQLCEMLVERRILRPHAAPVARAPRARSGPYARPVLLRQERKVADDLRALGSPYGPN